jgi:hypothetical protein
MDPRAKKNSLAVKIYKINVSAAHFGKLYLPFLFARV